MPLSLCKDQLFLFPSAKPKTLFNPSSPVSFFIFPNQWCSKFQKLQPSPLLSPPTFAVAANADTRTLPQSAIQRIAEKLRSLGYVEDKKDKDSSTSNDGPSPGQVFVPLPTQLPKYRVGHTLDPSWSTPENPVPEPGSGNGIQRYHELRRVVIKEKIQERSKEKENVPTLAELTLPKEELKRLRTVGIQLKKKLKVGKAGITEGIVNGIHERWKRSELVKITCEDICRMNMKRTHDLLERKTGGLVIWRSGSNIILYRGADYKYPYFLSEEFSRNDTSKEAPLDHGAEPCSSEVLAGKSAILNSSNKVSQPPLIQGVGSPNRVRFQLPGEAQLAEEADRQLEGLGPRFTDWWGYEPLPIDGDLLPAVVPGFRRPFRLLPYGVKPKLTNDEMTTLKRLARPLPCHFALGRNRKLQGLAAAIIKLWEKCEIAKIAVKRGVQNTNSKLMAEELKLLTGGILLSRDREFIVLYRGKDFLPAAVSSAIEERRKHELDNKGRSTDKNLSGTVTNEHEPQTSDHACKEEHNSGKGQKFELSFEERKLRSTEAAIGKTSARLSEALAKKAQAEKILAKLENEEITQQLEVDKECITEDEKYMLRKVGLRMKPFLLLGRRGVFAGTIENMHLHWKYRELVKIITGGRSIKEVHAVARTLEAESGGILVAVERVSKGYAIIVYRGKNYTRPASLRPQSLLNKKQAMKRSIEAQRRESLKLHVLKLSRNIDQLKLQLGKHEDKGKRELAKESKLGQGKEQEMNKMQSADYSPEFCAESFLGSQCNHEVTGNHGANPVNESEPLPHSIIEDTKDKSVVNGVDESRVTSISSESSEVIGNHGANLTSTKLNDAAQRNFLDFASQDLPRGIPVNESGIPVNESEPLPNSVMEDTEDKSVVNGVDESRVTSISSESSEVTGNHGANSTSTKLNDATPRNFLDFASQDLPRETLVNELEPLPKSIIKDTEDESVMTGVDESRVTSTSSESSETCRETTFLAVSNAEPRLDGIKPTGFIDCPKADSKLLVHSVMENGRKSISSRTARLSNKERLLLRKQALKMKRHPLFAIGKSNRVDGVAKAIKAHFEKHPLAIVNVKGRAKGTSVQEVVVKLEEATGAVLVSQEPSKVIMYRGWGAEEEPNSKKGKTKKNLSCSADRESNTPHVMSPELISAIRLECGL